VEDAGVGNGAAMGSLDAGVRKGARMGYPDAGAGKGARTGSLRTLALGQSWRVKIPFWLCLYASAGEPILIVSTPKYSRVLGRPDTNKPP
jgi:hypothetical protein